MNVFPRPTFVIDCLTVAYDAHVSSVEVSRVTSSAPSTAKFCCKTTNDDTRSSCHPRITQVKEPTVAAAAAACRLTADPGRARERLHRSQAFQILVLTLRRRRPQTEEKPNQGRRVLNPLRRTRVTVAKTLQSEVRGQDSVQRIPRTGARRLQRRQSWKER